MSLKRRVIRNIFSNWVAYSISIIVTFFVSPFVVHTLGNAGYGIWVLVGSLSGYLGLLDFGLRPTIVKFVSKYKALGDDRKINEVFNTVLAVYLLIAVVVVLASLVLSYFANNIFNSPPEYHSEMKIIIVLIGVNVALGFPFGVFNAIINALQRFDINNVINITVFLIRSLFVVVFLKLGGGLIALGIIVIFAGLLEFLAKARWCFKIFPALKFQPGLANRETLKMISGFSVYTFIIGISFQISFLSDSIVIGSFMSASAITFFAIGGNLISYLKQLASHVSTVLTPVASTFDAHQDYERLRQLLLLGTRYILLIILPVGFTFLVMGETFINLWMGEEYGPASSTVLVILTWAYFGFLAQLVPGSIFLGLGKIKSLAYLNLACALLNIIISIILVKPYGVYGVAFGTAIPLTLYGTFIIPPYICRTLNVRFGTYLKQSYLPPLLAALPFLIAILYIKHFLEVNSLVHFGVFLGLACCIYLASMCLVGLKPAHRKLVWEKAGAVIGNLKARS